MALVSWTWILVLLVVGYLKCVLRLKAKHKNERLPPGPKGIPILGNLLMLGKSPHRDLHRLAKQFGSIMYLQLGFVPTIVISSPQAAELFLKTHDLVFASRPFTEAAKHISYEQKGLSFTEYGPYWRNIRKLCTLELLSNMKIDSFKSMRREELGLFLRSVMDAARVGATVDVSAMVTSLSQDMACLMVLGDKYMNKDHEKTEFQAAVQEGMHLAAVPNVADYIPYVGALDLQGLGRRMKAVSKIFDDLFEKIIDERLHGTQHKRQHKDFINVMLSVMQSNDSELPIDRSNIKAVTLDMLAGSMDTTSTAIEWALAELLKNPQAMKKVQDELESVVGLERMVDESDLDNLVYLDMVIKESLRLHPVAPLLIPHESMEDCTVSDFHVPKKSRIIVNVWAIGRDPSAWPNAETFLPERFMGSDVDLRGRDFQLLPFGSGRRGCPGMQLGLLTIRLVLAQVLHCFDWKLASSVLPSELDMDEEFGLTMPRANHLLAVPAYRLNKPLI